MKSKYEEWIAKNTPLKRVSSLEPYRDEIQKLVSSNYTLTQITEYLRDVRDIEISRQSVKKFLASKQLKINRSKRKKVKRRK